MTLCAVVARNLPRVYFDILLSNLSCLIYLCVSTFKSFMMKKSYFCQLPTQAYHGRPDERECDNFYFREVSKADLLLKVKVLSSFEMSGTTHGRTASDRRRPLILIGLLLISCRSEIQWIVCYSCNYNEPVLIDGSRIVSFILFYQSK